MEKHFNNHLRSIRIFVIISEEVLILSIDKRKIPQIGPNLPPSSLGETVLCEIGNSISPKSIFDLNFDVSNDR